MTGDESGAVNSILFPEPAILGKETKALGKSISDIQKTVCRLNCACIGKSKTNCLKYFIVSSIKR